MEAFILDLAIILILGSVFALLCKILKQPIVLGYIVAGFIAGPHFSFFKTVAPEDIQTWADIGVIFLLFGGGLEFSFKKLVNSGKVAGTAIAVEILTLPLLGFLVSKYIIGWTSADSLLMGCVLISSSTAVIFKAFSELGLQKKKTAGIVFGISVFEDLYSIILMVIVTTFAVSKHFEGGQLLEVIIKLVFFLIVWVIFGIYLIPTFFKKIKSYLNDEILLLVSIGLCLTMVVFSTKVGFSASLGAFIMGSLLAETLEQERIERIVTPIKDLFGAIFFVSVGMMVNPTILVSNFSAIILITLTLIFGKMIFTTLGVRLAGENMKTSLQSGLSLAQMGEFSFIVANLGISLGVISSTVYSVAIAVSAISTFTTPYCIRLSAPAYGVIESIVPNRWHNLLYPSSEPKDLKTSSVWRQFLQTYFSRLGIYVIICIAISLLSFTFGVQFATSGEQQFLKRLVLSVATLGVLAIFLRPMIHNQGKQANLFLSLWTSDTNNRFFLSFLIVVRYIVAFLFVCMVINRYWALPTYIILIAAVVFFGLIFHSKRLMRFYWSMESRFVKNFNARQIMQQMNQEEGNMNEVNNLHWIDQNVNVAPFTLTEDSELDGVTLKNLNFRKKYNVLVISVQRMGKQLNFPDGDFVLKKKDRLLLLGSFYNLRYLDLDYDTLIMDYNEVEVLNDFNQKQNNNPNSKINCLIFRIAKDSDWIGKSLIDSSLIKDKCMVIAIERNDAPIVNPSSHVVFEENDFVWVMGDKKILYRLLEKNYFTNI
ncbi:MAG: cation:proton antiporter [Bacteroidota bacterium]|nr:cation:proton antiporter [Bacteroidota bacterium]